MPHDNASNSEAMQRALEELEQCVSNGEDFSLDELISRHAPIRDNDSLQVELIYHAFVLRQKHGVDPDTAGLMQQFPRLREKLQRVFAIDDAVWDTENTQVIDNHSTFNSPTNRIGLDPPPSIPGYEIEESLGHGAMGVVYKARHVALDRVVALKMIRSGLNAHSDELTRFRLEGKAVASLDHHNIVRLFDVGEVEGRPYFAQEFIAGGNLKAAIARFDFGPRQSARIVERLARAIHFAHQRGIVHRDLKPSNVLMGKENEPKLSDFGLAKQLDSESEATQSGVMIGTPGYMAPEQVNRKLGDIGVAADVYGLGAILYELLTREPPFKGDTVWETVSMVCFTRPNHPSRHDPNVPADLSAICMKCLEKGISDRYPNAEALANDLADFVAGKPVSARRVDPFRRGLKWVKRRPAISALTFAVVLLISVLGMVFAGIATRTSAQRETTRAEVDADLEMVRQMQVNSSLDDSGVLDDWPIALERMRRAETLLSSLPDDDVRHDQVGQLVAEFQEQSRIQALYEDLQWIRLEKHSFDRQALPINDTDESYDRAFREFGIDVHSDSIESIRRRFSEAQQEWIIIALDDWAAEIQFSPDGNDRADETERISFIADSLDQDLFRKRIRTAWRERSGNQLRVLAAEVDTTSVSTATRLYLAEQLSFLGDNEVAIQIVESTYWSMPGDFWVNIDLALLYYALEPSQLDSALRYAHAAIGIQPDNAGAYLILGSIYQEKSEIETAIELYRKALSLAPDMKPALNNLALALIEVERIDSAIEILNELRELDPNNPSFLYMIGKLRYETRDHDASMRAFQQLTESHPDDASFHFHLALAYYELTRFEDATAALKQCQSIGGESDPWAMMAAQQLAIIEELQRRTIDAPFRVEELEGQVVFEDIIAFAQLSMLEDRFEDSLGFFTVVLESPELFESAPQMHVLTSFSASMAASLGALELIEDDAPGARQRMHELLEISRSYLDQALGLYEKMKKGDTAPDQLLLIRNNLRTSLTMHSYRQIMHDDHQDRLDPTERDAWMELFAKLHRSLDDN